VRETATEVEACRPELSVDQSLQPPQRSVFIADPSSVDERLQNLPCPDINDEEGAIDLGNPQLQISVISLQPTISSKMSCYSTASVFGGSDDETATRLRQAKADIHKFVKKTEGDYKALASQAPDDNAADRQNVDECVGQVVNRTHHLLRESIDALNASDFLDADGLAK